MREVYWGTARLTAQDGRQISCQYRVLVRSCRPPVLCESYGVKVTLKETGEEAAAEDLTVLPERIAALDALGMVWTVPDYLWEENYAACMAYYRAHGNLDVPSGYKTKDGQCIGIWLIRQRRMREGKTNGPALTEDQIRRLDAIGMVWENQYARGLEKGLAEAKTYYERHGDLKVPASYISASGYKLGAWIYEQRKKRTEGRLEQSKVLKLDALGMDWADAWSRKYAIAKRYYQEHGNLDVPRDLVIDGVWLRKWLNEQKQAYHGKRSRPLSAEKVRLMEELGMQWELGERKPLSRQPGALQSAPAQMQAKAEITYST